MFKLSIQTGGPEEAFGIDGAYKLIRECGFDAADANIDHLMSYDDAMHGRPVPAFTCSSDKECLEYFRPWKEASEKYGVANYQAHAPFPGYTAASDEANDYLLSVIQKTIMGCDYIGCRNLIVHPFFLNYTYHMSPEDEWNLNIERYSKLIPVAKKYDVTICLENMFGGYRGKVYSACCSDIDTACRYIDTLNDIAGEKRFAFCLDTGHLLLLGLDIKNAMVKLGDHIRAFHVHDNNGMNDQHLAPYMGVQDWDRFIEGLKAIQFNQTLSFETFNVWNTVDRELCPDLMRFIAATGRMFARRAAE